MAVNDDDEFSLGDVGTENNQDGDFSLGESVSESEDSGTVEIKDPLASMDIDAFYKTFVEPYIKKGDDYSKSFESKIEIFNALGLPKFIKYNEIDKIKLNERIAFYKAAAKDKWNGKNEFTRIEYFLNQTKDEIFKNEKSYRDKLRVPQWRKQCDILYGKIDVYGADKIISTSEYAELLKQTEELGLDNYDKNYKGSEERAPEELIKEYIEAKGYKLLGSDEEFTIRVREEFEKDEKNKADTKKNKQKYFQLYYELKNNVGETASENEMIDLLNSNSLALLPKDDVFSSVYKNELSKPLEVSDYYKLQTFAESLEFTKKEWDKFCEKRGIEKPLEQKPNFYIGKGHVESIEDIPTLMDDNKDDVNINTIIGQLNGIKRTDLAEKLEKAQIDYKDDKDAIFEKTKYILNASLPPSGRGLDFNSCDYLEIAKELECKKDYYQNNLIGTKNSSLQLWIETRSDLGFDSDEIKFIKNAIIDDDSSCEKRLNKIILSLENNNFIINNKEFLKPVDIVDNADDETKKEISDQLLNFNSKIFCWLEKKFDSLISNVEYWATNERYNEITLSYALEQKTPFHFGTERINSISELESYILKNIQSKEFLDSLIEPDFLEELNFWEQKYQKSKVMVSFIPILFSMAKDISYKNTFYDFATYMEERYLDRETFVYYFEIFISLYNIAKTNGLIDESDYENHKKNLFDFIENNRNPSTYDTISIFINNELQSKKSHEDYYIDKSILTALFKYFFSINVDRIFYEENIHPALCTAIELGLIPESLSDEERQFFVDKYVSELHDADYETQCSLFQSIEKLDSDNSVLVHYNKSKEIAYQAIEKENFYKVCSNSRKRNSVLFLTSLVFLLASLAGVMRELLPSYVPVESINNFLFHMRLLIRPLSFLISTERGNFICSAIILILFIKPITSRLYAKKDRVVEPTLFSEDEDQDVIDFVVSESGKEEKTLFIRKSRYNIFSLIGRIFFAVLTLVCACGMVGVCFHSKYLFVFFAIFSIMIFTEGDVFEDNKQKSSDVRVNKVGINVVSNSLSSLPESAVNSILQNKIFISELMIFISCVLVSGNLIMKIIGALVWGIQIILTVPNLIKNFSIQDLVYLVIYVAAELFYWLLPSVFVYFAIAMFVLQIANIIYSKIVYKKHCNLSEDLLEKQEEE